MKIRRSLVIVAVTAAALAFAACQNEVNDTKTVATYGGATDSSGGTVLSVTFDSNGGVVVKIGNTELTGTYTGDIASGSVESGKITIGETEYTYSLKDGAFSFNATLNSDGTGLEKSENGGLTLSKPNESGAFILLTDKHQIAEESYVNMGLDNYYEFTFDSEKRATLAMVFTANLEDIGSLVQTETQAVSQNNSLKFNGNFRIVYEGDYETEGDGFKGGSVTFKPVRAVNFAGDATLGGAITIPFPPSETEDGDAETPAITITASNVKAEITKGSVTAADGGTVTLTTSGSVEISGVDDIMGSAQSGTKLDGEYDLGGSVSIKYTPGTGTDESSLGSVEFSVEMDGLKTNLTSFEQMLKSSGFDTTMIAEFISELIPPEDTSMTVYFTSDGKIDWGKTLGDVSEENVNDVASILSDALGTYATAR